MSSTILLDGVLTEFEVSLYSVTVGESVTSARSRLHNLVPVMLEFCLCFQVLRHGCMALSAVCGISIISSATSRLVEVKRVTLKASGAASF